MDDLSFHTFTALQLCHRLLADSAWSTVSLPHVIETYLSKGIKSKNEEIQIP
jgi:hypothetical protein